MSLYNACLAKQEQTPYALTVCIRLKARCLKYLVHGVYNIVLAVKTETKLVDANVWSFAVDKNNGWVLFVICTELRAIFNSYCGFSCFGYGFCGKCYIL